MWTKIRLRIGVGLESITPERRTPDSSCGGASCGAGNYLGCARRNNGTSLRTPESPATVWIEEGSEVGSARTDVLFDPVLRHGRSGGRTETAQQRGTVRRLPPRHL